MEWKVIAQGVFSGVSPHIIIEGEASCMLMYVIIIVFLNSFLYLIHDLLVARREKRALETG